MDGPESGAGELTAWPAFRRTVLAALETTIAESGIATGVRGTSLTILLLASLAVAPLAHAAEAERVIVTNAHLIGRAAAAQDVRVNLLIVDGTLAVVTKDELVIQPGDVAVDASAGFLFGELVLG